MRVHCAHYEYSHMDISSDEATHAYSQISHTIEKTSQAHIQTTADVHHSYRASGVCVCVRHCGFSCFFLHHTVLMTIAACFNCCVNAKECNIFLLSIVLSEVFRVFVTNLLLFNFFIARAVYIFWYVLIPPKKWYKAHWVCQQPQRPHSASILWKRQINHVPPVKLWFVKIIYSSLNCSTIKIKMFHCTKIPTFIIRNALPAYAASSIGHNRPNRYLDTMNYRTGCKKDSSIQCSKFSIWFVRFRQKKSGKIIRFFYCCRTVRKIRLWVQWVAAIQKIKMAMMCKCIWILWFVYAKQPFYTLFFMWNFFTLRRIHVRQSLVNLEFAIIDRKKENRKHIEKEIIRLGGMVNTIIHCNLAAVISSRQEIRKNTKLLQYAKSFNVHVISKEFLKDAAQTSDPISSLIIKRSLCEWGSDVSRLARCDRIEEDSIKLNDSLFVCILAIHSHITQWCRHTQSRTCFYRFSHATCNYG